MGSRNREIGQCTRKRPNHGANQITSVGQLASGMKVLDIHLEGRPTRLTIIGEPYQNKEGRWNVNMLYPDQRERVMPLADFSITPYQSGHWNQANHLEKPETNPS